MGRDISIRLTEDRPGELARVVQALDWNVIDRLVRAIGPAARVAGSTLRRAQTGLATAYPAWLVLGAVALAIAGVVFA